MLIIMCFYTVGDDELIMNTTLLSKSTTSYLTSSTVTSPESVKKETVCKFHNVSYKFC